MLKKLFTTDKTSVYAKRRMGLLLKKIGHGMGPQHCKKIMSVFGFSKEIKYLDFLTQFENDPTVNTELEYLFLKQKKLTVESKLKTEANFTNKLSLKFYKALRAASGLPVRGQRTHTNAKTTRKR